ncbi:tRNA dihydrouridine(20/20a) synthase DusA [Sulfidibacter corallicola]|uniref:tRNA-dihydrouridine(20/20a) synthase n=1 Tax=Sulfidibacter corallicola TaxID=2818388 RepID=A0A8A4THY3_SULCO|nr:tRNA dihydrouridine(20/20a) synthase DusA [Sulfidibacter corallicola]QTD49233.1 tRNA dihydrouridine(20/20a) synthase DusA [Sulfidibacter corallicola]
MKDYHRLSVAPMMAYTDRHFRFMMRQFTKRTLLYTEMVVGNTITYNLNSDFLDRVLKYDPIEHPIAVQLGGDDPKILATAARVCEEYGYDEINLNVGCPSDRVQRGRFGACLMKEPERVAEVVTAMRDVVSIPVNVKHRLGVDDLDSYEHLCRFIEIVSQSGNDLFIAHARKAWLKGLSPAQNRSVPPLRYDLIYQLKQDFPHLDIVINGGIQTLAETKEHLKHVDGVMVGRAAYQQPELFGEADHVIFGEPPREPIDELGLMAALNEYARREVASGLKFSLVGKHLVGLFKNRPRARRWRQAVSRLIQDNPKTFDLVELYIKTFGYTPAELTQSAHPEAS